MTPFKQKIRQKLIRFMTMQLFLSLASVPLMAAWGLPVSLISPLGNFIFHPMLVIFLLISSLIFFFELFCIPNGLLISVLEYLTAVWQKSLEYTFGPVMIAFKKPPLWLLIIFVVVTFASLRHRIMAHPIRRMAGMVILFIAFWACTYFIARPSSTIIEIPCNNGTITLIHQNNVTTLIDPGFLGQRISAPTWVTFTLIPEILKQTGSTTIDHMIVLRPGIITFDALSTLCSKMTIKHIYLPFMKGEFDISLRRTFNRFYALVKNKHIALSRFDKNPITINPTSTYHVDIIPDKWHIYRTIEYPGSHACLIIDNQALTLYDAKQKSNNMPASCVTACSTRDKGTISATCPSL